MTLCEYEAWSARDRRSPRREEHYRLLVEVEGTKTCPLLDIVMRISAWRTVQFPPFDTDARISTREALSNSRPRLSGAVIDCGLASRPPSPKVPKSPLAERSARTLKAGKWSGNGQGRWISILLIALNLPAAWTLSVSRGLDARGGMAGGPVGNLDTHSIALHRCLSSQP